MKVIILTILVVYLGALIYIYITQDDKVFNPSVIQKNEQFELKDMKRILFKVDDVILEGVYKKSQKKHAPLILYFGGNADDATRILLHIKSLEEFDIVAFNYRGFVNSEGKPSEKALFSDALKIYDKFSNNKEVIAMGRSLGTGIASFLASKRKIKGLILITPYDSVVSMAKKRYPYFPIEALLRHKFESVKYMLQVNSKVGLIEVKDDGIVPKYHFDKLKEKVKNLALHVELKNTSHGEVLMHPDFENTLKKMIKEFDVN